MQDTVNPVVGDEPPPMVRRKAWYEVPVWNAHPDLREPSVWPLEEARESWRRSRLAVIPKFAGPDVLGHMRAELNAALPHARLGDVEVEDMHGSSTFSGAYIPRDLLRPFNASLRLFEDESFRRWVGLIVGRPVYPVADPLGGCAGLYLPDGGEVDWHYDSSDLVTTVVVQEPRSGGDLEIDRGDGVVETHARREGDLTMFDGRRYKHRVTKVRGERHAMQFNFGVRPGLVNHSPELVRELFGRASALHREIAGGGGGRLVLGPNERPVGDGPNSDPWSG